MTEKPPPGIRPAEQDPFSIWRGSAGQGGPPRAFWWLWIAPIGMIGIVAGSCVEAHEHSGEIHVRDSKNPDAGFLTFTRAEWDAFIGGVRLGEFDFAG